ncbi:CMRF35-like molecule 4 [Tupaia chinensis]|uniref:CMRF35-like molecule 4 n=1 Tax=Tupaia chinensis TaxID=246437 RepID=UPI0007043EBA|nr:CMRF35-like molecule 4 [Tupaia chinensis]
MWLPPALLLLVLPGSSNAYPVTGPARVSGLERGSLSVQCHCDHGWENHSKWWCRGADWASCIILIQTTGSEQEVKKDRVSIRDDQENRTFTVTMEALRRGDADTYWCGIERAGTSYGVHVEVTIYPATTNLPTVRTITPSLMFTLETTEKTVNHPPGTNTSTFTRSLLSSMHFLLPVFLKLLLLLGLLSAVLWVNWPLRAPRGETEAAWS